MGWGQPGEGWEGQHSIYFTAPWVVFLSWTVLTSPTTSCLERGSPARFSPAVLGWGQEAEVTGSLQFCPLVCEGPPRRAAMTQGAGRVGLEGTESTESLQLTSWGLWGRLPDLPGAPSRRPQNGGPNREDALGLFWPPQLFYAGRPHLRIVASELRPARPGGEQLPLQSDCSGQS